MCLNRARVCSTIFFAVLAFVYMYVGHTVYGLEYVSTTSKQCKEPTIKNGTLYRGQKDAYFPGDKVTVLCDRFFRILGSETIKCKDDGTWSSNPPYCQEVVCSQLQQVINGSITPNPRTSKIGAVVKVACNNELMRVGPEELTCTIKGTWSPKWMPYCKDVKCPQLPELQNGTMNPKNPTRPGHVTFTCDEGLTLKGPQSLNCTEDGKWAPNVMPYCDDDQTILHHSEDFNSGPVITILSVSLGSLVVLVLGVIVIVCICNQKGRITVKFPSCCKACNKYEPGGNGYRCRYEAGPNATSTS